MIAESALAHVAETRRAFEAFLANQPDSTVYGVTSGYGHTAGQPLNAEERAAHAARAPYHIQAAVGEPLPDRVARGIVFARLASLVSGHAAVRPEIVERVAAMLDGRPLPEVPWQGQGVAGEILIHSFLFADVAAEAGTVEKEAVALINGAPAAAAFMADAALGFGARIDIAEQVVAFSYEALRAPLEHVDPVLGPLWGDEHEQATLTSLWTLLDGAEIEGRRAYQAPVSFRIAPRLLGRARRAQTEAASAAATALSAVTDNPIFLPPDGDHPWGRVLSNGSFHNARAAPVLDDLAATAADLCQLCERLSVGLSDERISGLAQKYEDTAGNRRFMTPLCFTHAGLSEDARHHAQRTFLPGGEAGGFGANDMAQPAARAWRKAERATATLDHALAASAFVASDGLARRGVEPTAGLTAFAADVRDVLPTTGPMKDFRTPLERLAAIFHERAYTA